MAKIAIRIDFQIVLQKLSGDRSEVPVEGPAPFFRYSLSNTSILKEPSGEQHQSYVLYDRAAGRRIAVYVPEELVPQVQRGLDNGRILQDLLQGGTQKSRGDRPPPERNTGREDNPAIRAEGGDNATRYFKTLEALRSEIETYRGTTRGRS